MPSSHLAAATLCTADIFDGDGDDEDPLDQLLEMEEMDTSSIFLQKTLLPFLQEADLDSDQDFSSNLLQPFEQLTNSIIGGSRSDNDNDDHFLVEDPFPFFNPV
jgi:hypothetical protein